MMLRVVPSPGAMFTEVAKFLNYSANIFLVITALEEFGVDKLNFDKYEITMDFAEVDTAVEYHKPNEFAIEVHKKVAKKAILPPLPPKDVDPLEEYDSWFMDHDTYAFDQFQLKRRTAAKAVDTHRG